MSRLENWEIIHDICKDCCRLTGHIYGDDRFLDDSEITTSRLIEIDFSLKEARTKNTIYNLGKMKNSLR